MTDLHAGEAARAGAPERFPATLDEADVALPPEVDDVLGGPAPAPPERWLVEAPTIPWAVSGWGSGPPVLLLHGVTSSGGAWWRIAPALAAAGFTVIAPDMPGHGETPPPPAVIAGGPFPFDAAARLVVELVDELAIAGPSLAVAGHSWGAHVAASLAAAGLVTRRLILLDPPLRDAAWARAEAGAVHRPASHEEALAMALERIPTGLAEDIGARADALLQLDPATVRAIFLSAHWDGALAALTGPAGPLAAGVVTSVVRGEPAEGAYVPDEMLARYAALLGATRVSTVTGGGHSFTRTHPRATLAALLEGLR